MGAALLPESHRPRINVMVEAKAKEMRTVGLLVFILFLVLATGCASHYRISLNNGSQIETRSKPRLNEGAYYYKDGAGRQAYVPAGAVREIAPASLANKEDNLPKPKVAK